jgi:NADPH:quinone reductase-like Zn-dependent oxidoreductase
MRAVLLTGHGGLDRLQVRDDVAVPTPAADEVLVRVHAAAVNNTDINTRIGWYSPSVVTSTADAPTAGAASIADGGWNGQGLRFPRIQGIDACGRIVAVGSQVDPARIGERVLVDPVLRAAGSAPHDVGYVGADRDGAFAQYLAVPARNAHRIDSPLSDEELASFPCSYATAELLLTRASVSPGEAVLITGASGGVGSAAIQLARARGARVVAVGHPAKQASLLALGAERIVPRDADLEQALGAESIDVVLDVVGGDAFGDLLGVLRRGGRYAVAGAIAGPRVSLDLRTLYLKDLSLLGCTVPPVDLFARLVERIERGEVRPLVSAIYPLERIGEAQTDFLAKRHTGKIVLRVP